MTDDTSEARARFVAELDIAGYLPDPAWRTAFEQVPRHAFLPRFFTSTPDGRWRAIDATHPDYLPLVYADTTLTTQLDGRTDPHPCAGPVAGTGTSSSTQPSLMAYMLDTLQVTGAQTVLEIGTGTGYNAALLAHRLGDHNVTTIEVDPTIADQARRTLQSCGYTPTIINADAATMPGAGRYDRIIATCSVPAIPPGWIRQTRDGGLILTSLWRDLGGGPMVRLDVNDNTAQGFFLPVVGGFMPMRSAPQATPALATAVRQTGDTRTTKINSAEVRDTDAGMWIALLVADATWLGFTPTDNDPQFWLFAPDGSWSMLDDTTMRVEQHGPRHLWDEVETAHQMWADAGTPHRDRVGLTVTADGTHRFWLDTPACELWTDTPPTT